MYLQRANLPFEGAKFRDRWGDIWTFKYRFGLPYVWGRNGWGVWDKGNGLSLCTKEIN